MAFKEYLDYILIPAGLLVMVAYHYYLYYQCPKKPIQNTDERDWVKMFWEVDAAGVLPGGNVSTGLGVISSSTTASVALAAISLTLCAVIGAWIASSTELVPLELVYGNTSQMIITVKYLCLLGCLLLAFSFFVQSARHFIHSSYLLITPAENDQSMAHLTARVQCAVRKGSNNWSLGLRGHYFALNFLVWFFGPIPMCICSFVTVVVLYWHDFKDSNDVHAAGELAGRSSR